MPTTIVKIPSLLPIEVIMKRTVIKQCESTFKSTNMFTDKNLSRLYSISLLHYHRHFLLAVIRSKLSLITLPISYSFFPGSRTSRRLGTLPPHAAHRPTSFLPHKPPEPHPFPDNTHITAYLLEPPQLVIPPCHILFYTKSRVPTSLACIAVRALMHLSALSRHHSPSLSMYLFGFNFTVLS